MGYESKIIVGYRNHFTNRRSGRDYCENIMTLDLCKVGSSDFLNTFNKEIDFDLYKDDGNTVYDKDCYGDTCCYAPIKDVISCLEKLAKEEGYYRRTDLALKALKAFKTEDWEWKSENGSYGELVVVHYGH